MRTILMASIRDTIPQLFEEDREDGYGPQKQNALQRIYRFFEPLFALLALASLVLQAIRTTTTPDSMVRLARMSTPPILPINQSPNMSVFLPVLVELGITIAFDVEIVWRLGATFPRWRRFFARQRNVVDLLLAVVCSVILIPPIQHSPVYAWLTAFQLMRFYRVILFVPGMRTLLVSSDQQAGVMLVTLYLRFSQLQVFGNMGGLVNMTIFLLLANFLAALFGIQLFRSDVPATFNMNFQGIVTSFLAMYQVFTSENWTDVLWAASNAEFPFKQQVIAILFMVIWFFFANCECHGGMLWTGLVIRAPTVIMLQMFIAVINEAR